MRCLREKTQEEARRGKGEKLRLKEKAERKAQRAAEKLAEGKGGSKKKPTQEAGGAKTNGKRLNGHGRKSVLGKGRAVKSEIVVKADHARAKPEPESERLATAVGPSCEIRGTSDRGGWLDTTRAPPSHCAP